MNSTSKKEKNKILIHAEFAGFRSMLRTQKSLDVYVNPHRNCKYLSSFYPNNYYIDIITYGIVYFSRKYLDR